MIKVSYEAKKDMEIEISGIPAVIMAEMSAVVSEFCDELSRQINGCSTPRELFGIMSDYIFEVLKEEENK